MRNTSRNIGELQLKVKNKVFSYILCLAFLSNLGKSRLSSISTSTLIPAIRAYLSSASNGGKRFQVTSLR